jgi:hypothetical protein
MSLSFNPVNSSSSSRETESKEPIVPKGQYATFTLNGEVLADEITVYIFRFLSERALEAVGHVCAHWKLLTETHDNILWKPLALSRGLIKNPEDQKSYRRFYRKIIKREYLSLFRNSILQFNKIKTAETTLDRINAAILNIENKSEREKIATEQIVQSEVEELFNLQTGAQKKLQRTEERHKQEEPWRKMALKNRRYQKRRVKKELQDLTAKRDLLTPELLEKFKGSSLFAWPENQQKILESLEKLIADLVEQKRNTQDSLSRVLSRVKKDPKSNAQLLFLLVAQSDAVFFLKDLAKEGKTAVPSLKFCVSLKMDPLRDLIENEKYAMLEYVLSAGLAPTQNHLKQAIQKLDCTSVELLLNKGAPMHGKFFAYLLIYKDTHRKYKYTSKLITVERMQLFKLLCQAYCLKKAKIPEKWNQYSGRVLEHATAMDAILNKAIETKYSYGNKIPEQQKCEALWTMRFAKGKEQNESYEEYAASVQDHNERIQRTKIKYSHLLAIKQRKEHILPNGFVGELRAAGLISSEKEESSTNTQNLKRSSSFNSSRRRKGASSITAQKSEKGS